jgi:predicted chitinase
VWFWKNHVKPKVSSYHDTAQVTKPINPAMRGLKDRETKFQAIKQGAMARPGELVPRGTKI